jgi:hypothetical protein
LTLPKVLDVGHVMLVEAFQSVGMNIVEAVERVANLGMPEAAQTAPEPPSEMDNDTSLMALEQMMSQVR